MPQPDVKNLKDNQWLEWLPGSKLLLPLHKPLLHDETDFRNNEVLRKKFKPQFFHPSYAAPYRSIETALHYV